MPKPITKNTLFYGDNLPILQEYIADESIDLVYLDPPFNSSRSYNVLFKDESGKEAESQITAFEDTWHWGRRRRRNLPRADKHGFCRRVQYDKCPSPVHRHEPDDGISCHDDGTAD